MARKKSGGGGRATKVFYTDPTDTPGKLPVGSQRFWKNNPQALRQMAEGLVFASLVLLLFLTVAPVYLRTTEQARRRSCQTNLHNAGMALEQYSQDNDGHLPPYGGDLTLELYKYLRVEGSEETDGNERCRALICPSDNLQRPHSLHETTVRAPVSYSYAPPSITNPYSQLEYVRTPEMWDYNGGITKSAHRKGGNVLYLDGHTRFIPCGWWSAADRPY